MDLPMPKRQVLKFHDVIKNEKTCKHFGQMNTMCFQTLTCIRKVGRRALKDQITIDARAKLQEKSHACGCKKYRNIINLQYNIS